MPNSGGSVTRAPFSGPAPLQLGPSVQLVSARATALPVGDTTLYTCPAGRVAMLAPTNGNWIGQSQLYNGGIASATVIHHVVPNGGAAVTGTRISLTSQVNGGTTTQTVGGLFVLTPGDSYRVNADVAGSNVAWTFLEGTPEDLPVAGGFISQVGTTPTTVYTVPAGKKLWLPLAAAIGAFNTAASAATPSVYHVPSGGAADETTKVGSFASVAASARSLAFGQGDLLPAGYTIRVASSVATSFNVWCVGLLINA